MLGGRGPCLQSKTAVVVVVVTPVRLRNAGAEIPVTFKTSRAQLWLAAVCPAATVCPAAVPAAPSPLRGHGTIACASDAWGAGGGRIGKEEPPKAFLREEKQKFPSCKRDFSTPRICRASRPQGGIRNARAGAELPAPG